MVLFCSVLFRTERLLLLAIVAALQVLNSQSKTLWKAAHPHPHSSMMCGLSRFAMDLNNDDPDLLHSVAPSDSRLRPE